MVFHLDFSVKFSRCLALIGKQLSDSDRIAHFKRLVTALFDIKVFLMFGI